MPKKVFFILTLLCAWIPNARAQEDLTNEQITDELGRILYAYQFDEGIDGHVIDTLRYAHGLGTNGLKGKEGDSTYCTSFYLMSWIEFLLADQDIDKLLLATKYMNRAGSSYYTLKKYLTSNPAKLEDPTSLIGTVLSGFDYVLADAQLAAFKNNQQDPLLGPLGQEIPIVFDWLYSDFPSHFWHVYEKVEMARFENASNLVVADSLARNLISLHEHFQDRTSEYQHSYWEVHSILLAKLLRSDNHEYAKELLTRFMNSKRAKHYRHWFFDCNGDVTCVFDFCVIFGVGGIVDHAKAHLEEISNRESRKKRYLELIKESTTNAERPEIYDAIVK